MQSFFTLNDLDVRGKRVFVRVDFNVPLDKKNGADIVDDKKIRESLPTIRFLIERGAKVILCSHLDRPGGTVVESLRLDKVSFRLREMLNKNVKKMNDCTGDYVKEEVMKMRNGDIILLENIRFYPGEEANDKNFSRKLAELAELYVDDAFGTCHRAHASTCGVAKYLKSAAGFLVEKDLKVLGNIMQSPKNPFIAIIGGGKISDKIKVIENLLNKVDVLLLGGALIYTFFKAQGKNIGLSKLEKEYIDLAIKLLKNKKIMLPTDVVIGDKFSINSDVNSKIVDVNNIPDDWMGLDIGPETIKSYKKVLKDAKTVLWSGPMGLFENEKFTDGTKEILKFLSNLEAITIVGGGDTAAAVEKFGFVNKLTHVSTGGGASLEFFEGKKLPGVSALEESYKKFNGV